MRMHANNMEDINEGYNGDIVALFSHRLRLGDTFCQPPDPQLRHDLDV
jgi:peptide subunit release factor RF-3